MSYSRWSHSCWYTFGDAQEVNNEPTLNVNCDERYPLSQLVADKESVLKHYRDLRFKRNALSYKGEGEAPKDRYTEAEIQELSEIIDSFVEDELLRAQFQNNTPP